MNPEPQHHPYALQDLRRQFDYLKEVYAGETTLRRYLAAVATAKNKIRDHSKTWSFVSGSKRVRKVQIKEFRMTAFYYVQKNGVPLILEFSPPGLQPRWSQRLERF